MFARMDGCATQLQNNPGSKGYIVTTAKKGDSWKVLSTERRLKSFLKFRGYGERFTFVNAGTGGQNSVEFWIIPEDANTSSITKRKSGNDLLRNIPNEPSRSYWKPGARMNSEAAAVSVFLFRCMPNF